MHAFFKNAVAPQTASEACPHVRLMTRIAYSAHWFAESSAAWRSSYAITASFDSGAQDRDL